MNIQKKFSSAPDFARHGAYFASLGGNSSCQPPPVKGEDTEEEKNASRANNNNYELQQSVTSLSDERRLTHVNQPPTNQPLVAFIL